MEETPYPVEEIIEYHSDPPKCSSWALVPLYKTTLQGKESFWQIGFTPEEKRLWISHGLLSTEEPQVKTREVITNNSKRTLQEQALLEARSRYKKMYYKGYLPAQGKKVFVRPMLANPYKEGKIKKFPVALQPKLDGVRALCSLDSAQNVKILSRTGKEWGQLNSIREEVKELLLSLPPGFILDGEIYSFSLTFEEISGLMRTTKGKREKEEELLYFIFDLIDDPLSLPFEKRYKFLEESFQKHFKSLSLVPVFLANSHEEIIEARNNWVNQGWEGCVIRRLAFSGEKLELTLYRPERNNNLFKFKSFQSEEVVILDIEEGKGTEEGLVLFIVKDQRGNIFSVRPRGEFAQRKEWFLHPEQVKGKSYTIEFFERTGKGVPRFPVGVSFRDYE